MVVGMNKLQHIVYSFIFFFSLTIVSSCDYTAKEVEIAASKKGIEKHLADPESVQYRNISIAKSLDELKYHVDHDKASKVLARAAPKASDYPGLPPAQFKLLVAQAENEFMEIIRNKVAVLNTEIAKGLYKNATGVCLEFNSKNKTGDYAGFEKALCLYTDGDVEADCLNVKLAKDKNSLFKIDLGSVCK